MICGEFIGEKYGTDSSRIPAQLLSGIGFIGAGTILRDGFNVKGLTTAASLLCVTCIGLSIGAGFYAGGIFAALLVYCILSYSQKIFGKIEHHDNLELDFILDNITSLNKVEKQLSKCGIKITKVKTLDEFEDESVSIQILGRNTGNINTNKLILEFSGMRQIKEIEIA